MRPSARGGGDGGERDHCACLEAVPGSWRSVGGGATLFPSAPQAQRAADPGCGRGPISAHQAAPSQWPARVPGGRSKRKDAGVGGRREDAAAGTEAPRRPGTAVRQRGEAGGRPGRGLGASGPGRLRPDAASPFSPPPAVGRPKMAAVRSGAGRAAAPLPIPPTPGTMWFRPGRRGSGPRRRLRAPRFTRSGLARAGVTGLGVDPSLSPNS